MKQKLYSFIQRGLFAKTLIVMLFAFAATGYAQEVTHSGTWGGIDWKLDDEGTFTVSPTKGEPGVVSSGYYKFEVGQWPERVEYDSSGGVVGYATRPFETLLTQIKRLVIEEGVTSIGSFSAQGMTNLTGEVVIPWTMTYIGIEAMAGMPCTKLTFQKVPAGKTGKELCIATGAFKNLIVEEFSFPDDRPVHIHSWVLTNCKKLKHVIFPATLTGILPYTHNDYAHNPDVNWSNDNRPLTGNDNLLTIAFGSEEVRDMYGKVWGGEPYYKYLTFVGLIGFTPKVGSVLEFKDALGKDVAGNDSTKFEQTEDKEYGAVVYTRKLLPTGKWNALYVPFEIPVSALGDDYDVAYYNNMHAYDSDHNGTIDEMDMEIILIEEGTLRAHHPYFIRAKNKAAENMSLVIFNSKVLSTMNDNHTAIKTSSAYLDFTLTGTYDTMTEENFNAIDGKNYAISTKGSWNRTRGIKPFRLYLNIKERPGSPVKVDAQNARVRMRVAGEETTSIDEVEMPVSIEQPTAIYDLQGRRVLNTEGLKGIYIVNGKKVAF